MRQSLYERFTHRKDCLVVTVINVCPDATVSDELSDWYIAEIVRLVIKPLNKQERLQLLLAAEVGDDPRSLRFYNKVKQLFTQKRGRKMHPRTKTALRGLLAIHLATTE